MDKRITINGVDISIVNQEKAINILKQKSNTNPLYICFPDTYTIFSATKDKKLLSILNNSWITMPDGKPLEFYARKKGFKGVRTVSGYWTCKALLAEEKFTHYFYGSKPSVLANLKSKLSEEFPSAKILGYKSPPFIELENIQTDKQIENDIEEIASLNPDFLWIGLSSPKQDYLMAAYYKRFSGTVLLGIGGVFEYMSGDVKKSPEWIKKIALRWLYRLLKEPKRLWRKYWFVFKAMFKVVFFKGEDDSK